MKSNSDNSMESQINMEMANLFHRAQVLKDRLPADIVQNSIYNNYAEFRKSLLESRHFFTDAANNFKTDFGIWVADVQKLIDYISDHHEMNKHETVDNDKKFVVYNVYYGYLNKYNEYSDYDLSSAALFTKQDMKDYGIEGDHFVITLLTDKQIEGLPYSLYPVKKLHALEK